MKNSVYRFVIVLLLLTPLAGYSQVGINTDTPNVRAVLDLHSPTNDQGLLVPRLSTSQRTAEAFMSRLTESENGLLIFDTDDKLFYYWMFPGWVAVDAGTSATAWRSGTDQPENSIGAEGDFYLNVLDGNVYRKNAGSYVLALNIKGDQGDPGPTGPAGPQGPQGLQGDPGPIGPAGAQGVKGDQGDPGPTGPKGPQGPQGLQGDPGPIGPAGPQGVKGDQGDVGPIGPAGPQGPQGLQGDTGPTGPAGPQGVKGDQGDVGPIGPMGPQGPQGLQGDPGPIGPAGPQGVKGDQGDVGPIGPMGPQGPQGLQGDPGPVGPAGPQGAKGDQGDPGPTGPAGPQGPTGPQGPQGEPGVPQAYRAVTVTSSYTTTVDDDVVIVAATGITITLPPASSVPGKAFHIRHNFGLAGLLGTATVRAPSGDTIVDGNASTTFTLGGLLNTGTTAITVVAIGTNQWYVIGKF